MVKRINNTRICNGGERMSWTTTYNAATGEYGKVWVDDEPVIEPDTRTLEAVQFEKQMENKQALSEWLASHPITWMDGKRYGVSQEDQEEMSLNLQQYQFKLAAGQPVTLEWHAKKEACRPFELEEFSGLLNRVIDYVYPYRAHLEEIKEQIYAAKTVEEVDAIVIDYSLV